MPAGNPVLCLSPPVQGFYSQLESKHIPPPAPVFVKAKQIRAIAAQTKIHLFAV